MASNPATFDTVPERRLTRALGGMWWLLLLRGLAAILFGIAAIAWPGLTLLTLILLWGAFTLADGVLALIGAFTGGPMAPRWWLALVGLTGIGAGLVAFFWPALTAEVLLYLIAFWAIAVGLFQIAGALALRKEIEGEWMLVLSGLLAILFGILLLARPGSGALALIFTIGIFALAYGLALVMLAFRVKGLARA